VSRNIGQQRIAGALAAGAHAVGAFTVDGPLTASGAVDCASTFKTDSIDAHTALGNIAGKATLAMDAGKHLDGSAAGSRIKFDATAGTADCAIQPGGDPDTGLISGAANILQFIAGGGANGNSNSGALNANVLTTANIFQPAAATPSIAANQNDWNPDAGAAVFIFVANTSGANLNITGLANGVNKRLVIIVNMSAVAGDTITLVHESASSAAANRFNLTGLANKVIAAGQAAILAYETTNNRWHS